MIYQNLFEIETKKGISIKDITTGVRKAVNQSGVSNGMCNIFLTATTAGIFINENELMLLEDLKKSFKPLADDSRIYQHPSNAFSHIRANIFPKEITFPVSGGDIVLGKWQSIFLAEFDNQERKRSLLITIMGE